MPQVSHVPCQGVSVSKGLSDERPAHTVLGAAGCAKALGQIHQQILHSQCRLHDRMTQNYVRPSYNVMQFLILMLDAACPQ